MQLVNSRISFMSRFEYSETEEKRPNLPPLQNPLRPIPFLLNPFPMVRSYTDCTIPRSTHHPSPHLEFLCPDTSVTHPCVTHKLPISYAYT